jgi:hypothetical protein
MDRWVSVIGLVMAGILVWYNSAWYNGGLRSVAPGKIGPWALIWVLIILVAAALFTLIGQRGS